MKQYASFEKYLEDKYYNYIHIAITGFIINRGRNNGFYSYTVLDQSYFQVYDMHVKTVSFNKPYYVIIQKYFNGLFKTKLHLLIIKKRMQVVVFEK